MRQLRTDRYTLRWGRRARRNQEETGIIAWFAGRKGVFVFLVIFGVLVGVFYALISFVPAINRGFVPVYHRFIAMLSARMLSLLGESTTAMGASIFSPRFSVRIVEGCDAIEATGLFMCAILAFPMAGLLQKTAGIVAGVFALAILNLVRIVSLFLIGVHLPRIVDFMHIEVWQGLFIIFAVMLWVVWLLWIARNPTQIQTVIASRPGRS